MQFVRTSLAGTLAAITAACSVSAPLSLDSTGTIRGTGESIYITVSEDDATPNRAAFGGALVKAFLDRSVAVSENGNLVVDYGVSLSDAKSGVIGGEVQAGKPAAEQAWLATSRDSRNFDKCDAQRLRGTLVLIDRQTNTTLYRGSATQIECEFSDRDMEAMASALVEDALSSPSLSTDD